MHPDSHRLPAVARARRNVETYNAPAQTAAERFGYDYPDPGLAELDQPVADAGEHQFGRRQQQFVGA